MRKALLGISLVLACGGKKIDYTKAKLEDIYRPFDLKSGIVKYKYTGEIEGVQELYFDDYGWKQVIYYNKMPKHGAKHELVGLDIITPERIVSIDLYKKKGSVRPNMFIKIFRQLWEMMPPEKKKELGPKIEKFSKEMNIGLAYRDLIVNLTAQSGIKKRIAGRQCEVYKLQGQPLRIFLWKKIVLGTELVKGGKVIRMEATEVKENAQIPPEKFDWKTWCPDAELKEYTEDSLYVKNERIFVTQLLNHYLGISKF